MLTIIYPFGDYTAADIAIKLQALSSIQEQSVYVVPKHFGRREEAVIQNLSNSKVVLFIVFDSLAIDEKTEYEINFLKSKNIPIYAFIPEDFRLSTPIEQTYKYKQNNKNDLLSKIETFISGLQKQPKNKNNDWVDLLIAMGLITGGLLLLNSSVKN